MMLYDEMIIEMTKVIKPMKGKRLLETGTGFGHSAKFFADLKKDWTIYTVDSYGLCGDGRVYSQWNPEDVNKVFDYFKECKNIVPILHDSRTLHWELPLDVLYIDAGHTYESCKADFDNYSLFLKKGGIIIFDDYTQPNNPTNGVKKVVDELIGYKLIYAGIGAILIKI